MFLHLLGFYICEIRTRLYCEIGTERGVRNKKRPKRGVDFKFDEKSNLSLLLGDN